MDYFSNEGRRYQPITLKIIMRYARSLRRQSTERNSSKKFFLRHSKCRRKNFPVDDTDRIFLKKIFSL